jgi:hypothetical protein
VPRPDGRDRRLRQQCGRGRRSRGAVAHRGVDAGQRRRRRRALPGQPPRRPRRQAPPADVWKALPVAYADIGLAGGPAIGQQQTFAAVIPSLRRRLDKIPLSRFLNCGTTPSGALGADEHLVRLQVTTIVEPQSTGTRLRTQVLARATSVENSNGAQECSSTGVLEQRLAQAVDARLGTP